MPGTGRAVLRAILGLGFTLSLGATEPGVDAVIAAHNADPERRTALIERLREDGITWIRERSSWPETANDNRPVWREAREAGLKVLAFARQVNNHLEHRPAGANRLGQNLLDVYRKSRLLASTHRGAVDAWELLNEPDFMFVADNPDSATAFQKAMYLGLKAGDPDTPVLRPAIGGSPNGYWEVALRNGLWDYGDASNVHFYGWPETLDEILEDHRLMDAHPWERGWTTVRAAPQWITEVNHYRGRFGRGYETKDEIWSEQSVALARMWELAVDEDVAVFMPFIVWWAKRPELSLFDEDLQPLPVWEAYVDAFSADDQDSQSGPLKSADRRVAGNTEPSTLVPHPSPLTLHPSPNPSPIVLQWVPDESTGIPNKFSGGYRLMRNADVMRNASAPWAPLHGEIRIYNFSDEPVTGDLVWETTGHIAFGMGLLESWDGRSLGKDGRPEIDPEHEGITSEDKESGSRIPELPKPFNAPQVFLPRWVEEGRGSDPALMSFEALAAEGGQAACGHSSRGSEGLSSKQESKAVGSVPRHTTDLHSGITIPPMSAVSAPVVFLAPPAEGAAYFRESFAAEFIVAHAAPPPTGRSLLFFNLEASPEWDLFEPLPLKTLTDHPAVPLRGKAGAELVLATSWKPANRDEVIEASTDSRPRQRKRHGKGDPRSVAFSAVPATPSGSLDIYHRDYPYGYEWTSQIGAWSGINGLQLRDVSMQKGVFQILEVTVDPPEHEKKYPRAVARLPHGLPKDAVIGLRASYAFTESPFNIGVFLVDRWGQAWRVDEQIPWHDHLKSRDKFLHLDDFVHSYFSNRVPGTELRPEDIIEIQLNFPHRKYAHPIIVALGVLVPR